MVKTAKPATSSGKFAAKAVKREPKAAAKRTAKAPTPKSQAVKTEPTEAVGKIGMERGQLSGLLTSLSYQCKAKKATPEHRAAAAKILSDYKAADVSGKSKILEKLVQSGMHCLDWANELTKNTEVQHEEANEFLKGFMTRSKILELNGLNESNLSEQVAADTLQDLLRESEERFKHTRQEQPHKNKLLHRYFYKMQKESTERDSATDTTRHSQTGTMDGELGSLMDAFGSGATSSIEVDMKGAFNKNVLLLKQYKPKLNKLHQEGLDCCLACEPTKNVVVPGRIVWAHIVEACCSQGRGVQHARSFKGNVAEVCSKQSKTTTFASQLSQKNASDRALLASVTRHHLACTTPKTFN
ncbi:unnamed protein product [Symbiodinium natans]|uniref:Uncharacterized protein n=1 Tax=Symbiodinium natans TaxID=878477 RepID=A0A812M9U0_9DINO|nr:unnamed protein product [Symbiodinium natans]